jgi:hypothetical protein
MRKKIMSARTSAYLCCCALAAAMLISAASAQEERKDYLTDAEGDQIRDARLPVDRIPLFVKFANARLKQFQYDLDHKKTENRRAENLNGLLNAYASCVDDAADQVEIAIEMGQDARSAVKGFQAQAKAFLDILQKLKQDGPELDTYSDTLDDAIDATQDALTDLEKASKQSSQPPIRRKP